MQFQAETKLPTKPFNDGTSFFCRWQKWPIRIFSAYALVSLPWNCVFTILSNRRMSGKCWTATNAELDSTNALRDEHSYKAQKQYNFSSLSWNHKKVFYNCVCFRFMMLWIPVHCWVGFEPSPEKVDVWNPIDQARMLHWNRLLVVVLQREVVWDQQYQQFSVYPSHPLFSESKDKNITDSSNKSLKWLLSGHRLSEFMISTTSNKMCNELPWSALTVISVAIFISVKSLTLMIHIFNALAI